MNMGSGSFKKTWDLDLGSVIMYKKKETTWNLVVSRRQHGIQIEQKRVEENGDQNKTTQRRGQGDWRRAGWSYRWVLPSWPGGEGRGGD